MPKPFTSIGKMRHRVVIQSLALTADGQGGSTEVWSTHATVWAELVPDARPETNFGGRVQVARTHVLNIRYLSTLTTTMRVTFNNRIFQIKGQIKVDERRFWMRVNLAEEGHGT